MLIKCINTCKLGYAEGSSRGEVTEAESSCIAELKYKTLNSIKVLRFVVYM
jgi:hypothetical protein